MKRMHAVAGGAMALALAGTTAWAGLKAVGVEVGIDTVNRIAYGGMGAARNSTDSLQQIGCRVNGYSVGNPSMACYARDENNTYVYCTSSVAGLVEAAGAVSGDTYIYFSWDVNGNCDYLEAYNSSTFEPKEP